MKYEIEKILIVTTAHLTRTEAADELAALGRGTLTRDEGFAIHTRLSCEGEDAAERDAQEQAELSEGALGVMLAARAQGCAWVLFDCDGPELDDVRTYEWDEDDGPVITDDERANGPRR